MGRTESLDSRLHGNDLSATEAADVMPAKAGIQGMGRTESLDSRLHGNDLLRRSSSASGRLGAGRWGLFPFWRCSFHLISGNVKIRFFAIFAPSRFGCFTGASGKNRWNRQGAKDAKKFYQYTTLKQAAGNNQV
jgi:hypothetical protein